MSSNSDVSGDERERDAGVLERLGQFEGRTGAKIDIDQHRILPPGGQFFPRLDLC